MSCIGPFCARIFGSRIPIKENDKYMFLGIVNRYLSKEDQYKNVNGDAFSKALDSFLKSNPKTWPRDSLKETYDSTLDRSILDEVTRASSIEQYLVKPPGILSNLATRRGGRRRCLRKRRKTSRRRMY